MDIHEMRRLLGDVDDAVVNWEGFCGDLYDVVSGEFDWEYDIGDRFFELMDDMEEIEMGLRDIDAGVLKGYDKVLRKNCRVVKDDMKPILRGNYENFRYDEISRINSFLSVVLADIYRFLEVEIISRRSRD